jgi:hypothetical protein
LRAPVQKSNPKGLAGICSYLKWLVLLDEKKEVPFRGYMLIVDTTTGQIEPFSFKDSEGRFLKRDIWRDCFDYLELKGYQLPKLSDVTPREQADLDGIVRDLSKRNICLSQLAEDPWVAPQIDFKYVGGSPEEKIRKSKENFEAFYRVMTEGNGGATNNGFNGAALNAMSGQINHPQIIQKGIIKGTGVTLRRRYTYNKGGVFETYKFPNGTEYSAWDSLCQYWTRDGEHKLLNGNLLMLREPQEGCAHFLRGNHLLDREGNEIGIEIQRSFNVVKGTFKTKSGEEREYSFFVGKMVLDKRGQPIAKVDREGFLHELEEDK